jgi:hypothetical protein
MTITTTKTYASIFNCGTLRPACDDFEITNESEILQRIPQLAKHDGVALRFQTYQINTAVVDGETLGGQPRNHSPYSYANLDRIYTRAEAAIEKMQARPVMMGDVVLTPQDRQRLLDVKRQQIADFAKGDPLSVFFKTLAYDDHLVEATPGVKVFGKGGVQLHPAPAQPAPVVAATPDPAP